MAETERSNLPIAEEPEFTTEIPAIRPDDLVHFAQMNAMLESLLGNDVFLQRLANKMIENSLIAHVLDCENPQMVLGADQAPVITGLIDGVKEDVTQLYSDIQDLTNGLSALDTRVTNAINGGDLAPPFEYNYLISNYITNKDGGIVTTADTASAWTFYDTGHPSTGTKYGMARTWPTQTAIKRNYKLVVNISAPVNGPVIELLNASGAAVVTISNLNSTTDLSQFAGQTLYPRFRGTYGYNNGARRTINFNTLKIFKQ